MEIAWLEDFIALADCMNFSRAADQRGVTQPAFSRRIRALESWVGNPLFDRGSHRIRLTPAGEAFRLAADEVLARLNRGREEARRVAQSASTSLRFASTHALSLTYFPKWLRTMDATVANSTVELVADHMVACERLMLDGKAQFLLCHDHPAASNLLDRAAFQSVCLGLDVLVPVAAADANGRPQHILPGTPEAPVPHLAYNDKSGLGRIIAAAWARTDRPLFLRPVFTSHLAIALKTLALDGRGVVWSPLSLIADNLAPAGALVRAGDERWDIPIEIHLFRPRARQAAFAEAFWAALSTAGAAKG